MKDKNGKEITECSGMMWHNAIENTLWIMRGDADKVLNFRDDWQAAEEYAIKHKLHFDFNGELVFPA